METQSPPKSKRLLIGLIMSAIATLMIIPGLFGFATIGGLGVILSVISFLVARCLLKSLVLILRLSLTAWSLVPLFPVCLLPAAFVLSVGLLALLATPVLFLLFFYRLEQNPAQQPQETEAPAENPEN